MFHNLVEVIKIKKDLTYKVRGGQYKLILCSTEALKSPSVTEFY